MGQWQERPYSSARWLRASGTTAPGSYASLAMLLGAVLLWATVNPARAQAPATNTASKTLPELQRRLAELIGQPRFRAALWGVKIVSLDTGQALFDFNAHKLLKPASVAKLYSGALALDRFGPEARIRTSLYAASRPDAKGTLAGDLIVYGRGDPSFAARFYDGDYAKSLEPLATALAKAGVKRIQGDLVGDESHFRGPPLGSGWMWEDLQNYYGPEVSALTADDNAVDLTFAPGTKVGQPCLFTAGPATPFLNFINQTETVADAGVRQITIYRPLGENTVYLRGRMGLRASNHVDAVTVHQPALWFLTRFREALAQRGIGISGHLRSRNNWLGRSAQPIDYARLVELAHSDSRPMAELVTRMMKPSQNLYAQLLLLQAGANSPKSTNQWLTTEELGLAEMETFLAQAGIRKGEALLDEGSGLSRGTLVTPNATVALLQFMQRHRYAQAFQESLPLAGVDGSLRRRMKDSPAAGNARAKPGSIRYVNTLAGYVTTASGERLAFALMLNNYRPADGSPAAREELDALVILLAQYAGKSS